MSSSPVSGSGVRAATKATKSSGVRTKNCGSDSPIRSHAGSPSARSFRAMPRPSWSSSRVAGLPVPLENRTVAGTAPPCIAAAVVSPAAAGVAVNVPVATIPVACARRFPAWRPDAASIASTSSSPLISPMRAR